MGDKVIGEIKSEIGKVTGNVADKCKDYNLLITVNK